MRPRVFPAEDAAADARRNRQATGFNEAAGIPRGRRTLSSPGRPAPRRASMRPRVFPAEDPCARSTCAGCATSFNEAAGIPRGRHVSRSGTVDQ